MKKIILAILLLTVIFLATSFKGLVRGRTEIENLYSITLAGIDKNDVPGKEYLVTTVSPTTEKDAVKPNNVMFVTGKTAFDANRNIGMYAENDIYWGHTKYILIGESASKENVFKYLDFLMRDNEPRITLEPLVVMGTSSHELIGKLYEQNLNISQNIETIVDNFNLVSYSSSLKFPEVIQRMSQSQDGYLPCIQLEEENSNLFIEQGSEEVEKGKIEDLPNTRADDSTVQKDGSQDQVMHSPGYALIKDGKVVDYLLHEQGRGLNWIIDKIVSGVIVVEHEGAKYNLEITQSGSKIEPKIVDETLQAEIKISVCTNITEISESNIRVDENLIQVLEKILGDTIKKEVTETVDILQKHEVDVIGLGDKFYHKYPVKWEKKYKEKWEETFPDLDIKITIDPNIERSSRFYESIFFKGVK